MSWQSDINDAIEASAPLAALIGDRFSWDIADGTTATPYLVAQVISSDGETDFDGNRDVAFPLIQFTAWSPSKAQAIAVMDTFGDELEGRNLPGDANISLGYAGEQSTYDRDTKFYGEIREYRASTNTN